MGRLLARALMVSNLVVGVFNLLPGLPLDGGRVLSAAVWRVTGRRHTGTVVAAWLGRGAGGARAGGAVPARCRRPAARSTSSTWSGAACWVRSSGSAPRSRCSTRWSRSGCPASPPGRSPAGRSRSRPTCRSSEALRRAHEAGASALVVVSTGGDPVGLVVEAAVTATPAEPPALGAGRRPVPPARARAPPRRRPRRRGAGPRDDQRAGERVPRGRGDRGDLRRAGHAPTWSGP